MRMIGLGALLAAGLTACTVTVAGQATPAPGNAPSPKASAKASPKPSASPASPDGIPIRVGADPCAPEPVTTDPPALDPAARPQDGVWELNYAEGATGGAPRRPDEQVRLKFEADGQVTYTPNAEREATRDPGSRWGQGRVAFTPYTCVPGGPVICMESFVWNLDVQTATQLKGTHTYGTDTGSGVNRVAATWVGPDLRAGYEPPAWPAASGQETPLPAFQAGKWKVTARRPAPIPPFERIYQLKARDGERGIDLATEGGTPLNAGKKSSFLPGGAELSFKEPGDCQVYSFKLYVASPTHLVGSCQIKGLLLDLDAVPAE